MRLPPFEPVLDRAAGLPSVSDGGVRVAEVLRYGRVVVRQPATALDLTQATVDGHVVAREPGCCLSCFEFWGRHPVRAAGYGRRD